MEITTIPQSRLLRVLLVGSVLVWGGCSTTGPERAQATAESMQSSVKEIEKGTFQIKNALVALEKLQQSAGEDPRTAFKVYSNTVDDIESSAARVKKTVEKMKDYSYDYYATWQKELTGMSNDQLKSISAGRQARSKARFQKVLESYNDVAAAYKPFITDLRDIRTHLSNDLTGPGIDSIKSVAEKAKSDASDLTSVLDILQSDFNSLAAAIATYKK